MSACCMHACMHVWPFAYDDRRRPSQKHFETWILILPGICLSVSVVGEVGQNNSDFIVELFLLSEKKVFLFFHGFKLLVVLILHRKPGKS